MPRNREEFELCCFVCHSRIHIDCSGPAICPRCGARLAIEWSKDSETELSRDKTTMPQASQSVGLSQ